ncbi:hypothetical protein FRX31_027631 [Thalictrum thalictroides]|uniref:Uncharacterized protein n=1 Tax=Thalictrum thalictroides TaxID=46969 RepID=A0A7J6VDF3_THATH|nr:hypothetical protein FRX31_027631 [Thalictrum thalictroides]
MHNVNFLYKVALMCIHHHVCSLQETWGGRSKDIVGRYSNSRITVILFSQQVRVASVFLSCKVHSCFIERHYNSGITVITLSQQDRLASEFLSLILRQDAWLFHWKFQLMQERPIQSSFVSWLLCATSQQHKQ